MLILSAENSAEIALINNNNAFVCENLTKLCQHFSGEIELTKVRYNIPLNSDDYQNDLQDIIGQEHAKRVLEIAAAGGHNLLLIGPPGTGKTMLATRLNDLLPPLNDLESLQTATINSLVNQVDSKHNWRIRPFRAPHHSTSIAALVGGGSIPKPGEISLAHNGILFLDELPEFSRKVLDALREPLESGEIVISRANIKVLIIVPPLNKSYVI